MRCAMPARKLGFMPDEPCQHAVNFPERHWACWDRRTTHAYKEALRSVFSSAKRKARGDRTSFTLINMLDLVAGKLLIPMASYNAQPLCPATH